MPEKEAEGQRREEGVKTMRTIHSSWTVPTLNFFDVFIPCGSVAYQP
jgi:hypothetical protein